MQDCIFCKIVEKEIPATIVWESDNFIAFLDLRPVNPGHTLLIPKYHTDSVFDLPENTYNELFNTAKALSAPLQKAMQSKRIGMVVEGFGVPHCHVHLVPINNAHELDSSRAKPAPPEELTANAAAIRQEIKNL